MKAIAAKLVKIMQECSYVPKNGFNKFHQYNYALAADVLDKVGEACVKYQVATVMNTEILDVREITTNAGKKEYVTSVKIIITLIDADSGETLTITGLGSGQDAGDKGLMKAETAAIKYAWMLSLNISTGDDPETDETTDERNNTKDQQKTNTRVNNGQPKELKFECSDCKTKIEESVYKWSLDKFKRSLCRKCQTEEKNKAKRSA